MTSADATGLDLDELQREVARFGVAEEQVRRDHLISHVLAAISASCSEDVIFFGGTALSRTHLAHSRLSEDIDLIATTTRGVVLPKLVRAVERALLRTHGRTVWIRPFTDRDTDAAVMSAAGVQLQVQLLRGAHYPAWPVEQVGLHQRYSDAPPAILTVPTLPAFSGWKVAAWSDRSAPRDLYDLWALNQINALTAQAAELFARYGPTGRPPQASMFVAAPAQQSWLASLSGQTRLTVTAEQALRNVRLGWARAVGADWT